MRAKEGRLRPLLIDLEKNPATIELSSYLRRWASPWSIGNTDRLDNRPEGSFWYEFGFSTGGKLVR